NRHRGEGSNEDRRAHRVHWRSAGPGLPAHLRPCQGREIARLAAPDHLRRRARADDRLVPQERKLVAAADVDAPHSHHLGGGRAGAPLTGPIPFFQHDLGQPELDAIREVLSGPILTTGATVERIERRLADYLGAKHVLAVTSCTGALHLSLLALGIGP